MKLNAKKLFFDACDIGWWNEDKNGLLYCRGWHDSLGWNNFVIALSDLAGPVYTNTSLQRLVTTFCCDIWKGT